MRGAGDDPRTAPLALARLLHVRGTGATVARGAGLAFVLHVAGAGLGFLVQVILARQMAVGEYGVYAFVFAWASVLAVVAGLGLPGTSLRFVSAYRAQEDWSHLRGVIRATLVLTAGSGLVFALVATPVVLALDAAAVLPDWRHPALAVWLASILALSNVQVEMSRAFGRLGLAYAPSFVGRPLLIILGAFLLGSLTGDLDSFEALLVTLAAAALVVSAQLTAFRRRLPERVKSAAPALDLRRWFRVSFPLLLVAGFGMALRTTDLIMVGALLGPTDAALYSAASRTAALVGLVLLAVNAVSAPMFAGAFVREDRATMQRLATIVAHMLFWPSLVIALALVVLADAVLGLFGPEFVDARWPLVLLIAGQVASAAAGSVGYLTTLTGHQHVTARVLGTVAAANVGLNAVAIPFLGLVGAAVATGVSTLAWNIWLHTIVVREFDLRPSIVSALRPSLVRVRRGAGA